ncbi:receptor like protein kinase S.2-like [Vigna umbellata]|uniref:receptor like protein kinase S.2-like n=1 Tax=Vigna umbellata TaxID=87088 RepID=UPI001F5FC16E|nr:receptor like protein kinase S.2-like [Vigna umbellata]
MGCSFFSSDSNFPMWGSVPLFSGASAIHGSSVEFSETTTTTEIRKSQFSVRETIYSDCSPLPCTDGQILKWPELKVFSFEELKSATGNFKSNRLVGEGGFDRVYKGWLDENTLTPAKPGSGVEVAIKIFNPEGSQGFAQWQSEVNVLGRLSHPNVVRLLGYCWDEDQFLLVFEFMSKGSLSGHLFIRNHEPLSWNTRLKIIIGAARGLAFLHANENKVIFRDFKTSNILLDGNYNAKLTDFGLAKLGPSEGQSHVNTSIIGTYGYAAPEYIATGDLYVKSDVYGFGVVLLEILTGMRALDTRRPTGQQNLVEWTKSCLSSKRKLKTIMDSKIEGQYSPKAALQAAQLALKCLVHDPYQRPSMEEVLEGLEAIEDNPKPEVPDWRKMGLCFSGAPSLHSSSLNRPHYNICALSKLIPKQEMGSSFFSSDLNFPMTGSFPLFSGSPDIHGSNVVVPGTNTTTEIGKSQFSMIETIYSDYSPLPFADGQILKWPELKVFSLRELKSATGNFKSDRLVGEGGFGRVYKGWLDENTLIPAKPGSGVEVAIKMFNPESYQGFAQWQSEVNFLGRLSHPNVIRLLGYCWDEDHFLLVYEFMPNGSLDCHLFKTNHSMEPLSWNTRLKIAKGAARGLAFLHATENKVIFRDFKPSNILLDENYDAKLSDFGLAKLGPSEGQSHVTTKVFGTYGYAAPEYVMRGQLFVKSDVYGFGVVLLEILTGMRAVDKRRPTRQQKLVEWTKPCLSSEKKLNSIIDCRIKGQISPMAALESAQLIMKCLEHDPEQRPSMKEVFEGLEAIEDNH